MQTYIDDIGTMSSEYMKIILSAVLMMSEIKHPSQQWGGSDLRARHRSIGQL